MRRLSDGKRHEEGMMGLYLRRTGLCGERRLAGGWWVVGVGEWWVVAV